MSLQHLDTDARVMSAAVIDFDASGAVVVQPDGHDAVLSCWQLATAEGPPPRLFKKDRVLVWVGGADRVGPAVVLGRIEAPTSPQRAEPKALPDELVLEARSNLTLRCGDGSITLREDGKILVKGVDLVSHARRMNRIKGGGVSIN